MGRANPASSRAQAWLGVFDCESGDIIAQGRILAPVNAPRPMKGKPDRMMVVASSTSIRDVTVGPDGHIHLVGYARGDLPWTKGSPNTTIGAPTWGGPWGNPEAARDPFVISLTPDFKKITRCWSFSAGDTDIYDGTIHAVAAGPDGHIALAGTMVQPGSPLSAKWQNYNKKRPQWRRGPPESYYDANNLTLTPDHTVYLQDPWQHTWGGLADGYVALLDGKIDDDPKSIERRRMIAAVYAHTGLTEDQRSSAIKNIERLTQSKDFSSGLVHLADSDLPAELISNITEILSKRGASLPKNRSRTRNLNAQFCH